MKKKILALLLCLAMLTTLLTGCGGSSTEKADAAIPRDEPAADAELSYGFQDNASGEEAPATDQKLIKRVSMEAETEDLESLLPQITAKVAELGGYIENQELHNGSAYASYRSRSVTMTVRIPAERLDEFTRQVEGVSNVVNYTESAEDVTLQYVDTESRVKALEVEQQRLLELLENAETMADLLEIESRLTDVRYELENYASRLRALENKVSYATVNLFIRQVKVYTEVEPQTVWQRIGGGFRENLVDIGQDLTDLFVWLVTYSPQLIFWALVIFAVIKLFGRKLKKKKVSKVPMEKPEKGE